MYPAVIKVIPQEHHTLSIEFNDGSAGTLDIAPYLDFGVFRRLQDPLAFAEVKVSFDTIEWKSGADLDPEFIYRHIRKQRLDDPR